MGILKLLLLGIGVLLILRLIGFLSRSNRLSHRQESKPDKDEKMISCHHCGLHIPESQALKKGDHSYCCPEHLEQD